MFLKNNLFLYINENCNYYHQRKIICTFFFKQKTKKLHTFLRTINQTICKKQDNFRYVLYTKIKTF